MKEIKTVIEKLKSKVEELKKEREANLKSIEEKQNEIASLNHEIDDLNHNVTAREDEIAKLEAKIEEAKNFDSSLDEVATLVAREETPAVEEAVVPETPVEEEATVEDVKADTFNPFGDITAEEEKAEPFEFKSTMDDFAAPTSEFPTIDEVAPAVEEPVAEEPAVEEPVAEEPVVDEAFQAAAPVAGNIVEEGYPIINENGFDVSAQVNPEFGMNEMYNDSYDPTSIVR